LLRRLVVALTAVLLAAALVLVALVGLAVAGRPAPLGRLVVVAERAIDLVDELLAPYSPDDQEPLVQSAPTITHGVASGDVAATSAVIWSRASGPAMMNVEYDVDLGFASPRAARSPVAADADFTARVVLRDLAPNTEYVYRVWLTAIRDESGADRSGAEQGRFRTAAGPDDVVPVSFVFAADLGGARYCRRSDVGYPIFEEVRRMAPTFFLALGDMIYADNSCPRRRPDGGSNIPGAFRAVDHPSVDWADLSQLRLVYWAHWRYNRADASYQRLLASTPMYGMWDDHEVINNFGGSWTFWRPGVEDRSGYANLVAAGRGALFAYTPIERNPEDPDRLYRSFTWGRDLELFLLDVRSYRSRNEDADTADQAKTMLGQEQLAWLKREVGNSRATWKVIASGVPLSAPTGGPAALIFGRDGWASGNGPDGWSRTGFERELQDLLRYLDQRRVTNLVFVSGDLHQALAIAYRIDLDGDGSPLEFHEFVAGPLSAATRTQAPELDPTLNPSLLFSDGGQFNFGYVRIQRGADNQPRLSFDVRGADDGVRPGLSVELVPQE
jgi:alkaline phosphatase D